MNRLAMLPVFCLTTLLASPLAAESESERPPIKLAYIEALSGPFEAVGQQSLEEFQFVIDEIVNKRGGLLGGRKLELVPFDSRGSARTTQRRLRQASEQGISYVLQGNSSHVANTLIKTVDDRNRRQPDDPMVYLNFAANDPSLTNESCSFWHFRFDSHVGMKIYALTDAIAERPEIRRVYLIGQDYSFGHAVAETTTQMLREKAPQVDIVGLVFHRVGMETDFSPFVEEIVEANPDAIVTGNWGTDIILLGQALGAAGVDVPVYTLYGAFAGTTAAIGEAGNDKIHLVHGGEYNPAPPGQAELYRAYKEVHPDSDLSSLRLIYTIKFLAKAIEKAGTADPLQVALAMEDMEYEAASGRMVRMRKSDHQLIQTLAVSVQTDEDIEFDISNTGIGLKTVTIVESDKLAQLPTTCDMQRPHQQMTQAK